MEPKAFGRFIGRHLPRLVGWLVLTVAKRWAPDLYRDAVKEAKRDG